MEKYQFCVPSFSDDKLREFLYLATSRCVRGLFLANKRDLDAAPEFSQQITSEINKMVIVMHCTVIRAKSAYLSENPQASQTQLAAFVWAIVRWCFSEIMKKYRDYHDLAAVEAEHIDEILGPDCEEVAR
jgi:hypothetical protein